MNLPCHPWALSVEQMVGKGVYNELLDSLTLCSLAHNDDAGIGS